MASDIPYSDLQSKENQEKLQKIRDDPVLFAELLFKNRNGKPWKAYPYQAEILRSKAIRKLINSSRQIGKSECVSIAAIHHAVIYPNQLILIISRSQEQSSELLRKLIQMVWASPIKNDIVKSSSTKLSLTNGSMIVSLPTSAPTIRGYSPDLVILDEGAHFQTDEIFYESVRPMLMHTHGKLIIASTPKGKRGFFYEMYREWSKEIEEGKTDVAVWNLPCIVDGVPICPAFTMDDIEREKREMDEFSFRQEYMAEFVDESNAYFPYSLTLPCIQDFPMLESGNPTKKYYMGIDWGKVESETVITLGEVNNEVIKAVSIKVFVRENYSNIMNAIMNIISRFNVVKIFADTGSGLGQIDELESRGAPIEGIAMSMQKKEEMFANLRKKFEERKIIIPDNNRLIEQLHGFGYQFSKNGNLLLHHTDGLKDDYVDSLALMVLATKEEEYEPVYSSVKHW